MASEASLERFAQLVVTSDEERAKDREECKALWRATQRRIDALTDSLRDLGWVIAGNDVLIRRCIQRFAVESRAAVQRLAVQRLGARIDALVSAMGEQIRQQQPK